MFVGNNFEQWSGHCNPLSTSQFWLLQLFCHCAAIPMKFCSNRSSLHFVTQLVFSHSCQCNTMQLIKLNVNYTTNAICQNVPRRSCCYSYRFETLFRTNSTGQEDNQFHLRVLRGGHCILKEVQGGRFHHHQVRTREYRFCRAALLFDIFSLNVVHFQERVMWIGWR